MENKKAKKFWEKLFLAQQSCSCDPVSLAFDKNMKKKINSENLNVENEKKEKKR